MGVQQKQLSWKTKTGAIMTALGGGLLAGAKFIMGTRPDIALWLGLAGTVLFTSGGSLAAVGIGHKIEKAADKMANSK